MTTLIAWTGADQRGANEWRPASIYIAADSRISWAGTTGTWDSGRKLFAAREEPHLLGYCGDVGFAVNALGQLVEMIEHYLLFPLGSNPSGCADRIVTFLTDSLREYPPSVRTDFSLLYATREGVGTACSFHLFQVDFRNGAVNRLCRLPMPARSGLLAALGSGADPFKQTLKQWDASEVGGTSRALYSAFASALTYGSDRSSGGPAQLVGLYRMGGGRSFGTVWRGKRYFLGTEVKDAVQVSPVQWHNELFEICDPLTLTRKGDAQPQPMPRSLQRPQK